MSVPPLFSLAIVLALIYAFGYRIASNLLTPTAPFQPERWVCGFLLCFIGIGICYIILMFALSIISMPSETEQALALASIPLLGLTNTGLLAMHLSRKARTL